MGCCFSSRPSTAEANLGYQHVEGCEFLQLAPPIDVVASTDEQNVKARDILARAFAGTESTAPDGSFDWVLGPHLQGNWSDERRYLYSSWMHEMGWEIAVSSGGFVIGVKDTTGNIGGVAVFVPYVNGWPSCVREICTACRAFRRRALDEPPRCCCAPPTHKLIKDKKIGKGIGARTWALADLDETRKKLLPAPHVHLMCLAVDPAQQGHGFGGKLLREISRLADCRNLPVYLETSGERNISIYKRFGFEIVAEVEVKVSKGDPDNCPPKNMTIMIRTYSPSL